MAPGGTSSGAQRQPYRRLTTVQTVLVAAVALIVGLVCLYLGGSDGAWWQAHKSFQGVVRDVGSLLFVSVALGTVWELIGKRSFAREVLDSARTTGDVEAAGLSRIGVSYLDDPDWEALFQETEKLDIFVAYGSTWRNRHLDNLEKLAGRPGGRIRVFLPDPDEEHTLAVLSKRFGYTTDDLAGKIRETRSDFEGMRKPNGSKIEIYYRPGDRVFSFYRFDAKGVITFYNHKGKRSPMVPTLVFNRGGTLYTFVETEIEEVLSQSKLLSEDATQSPPSNPPN